MRSSRSPSLVRRLLRRPAEGLARRRSATKGIRERERPRNLLSVLVPAYDEARSIGRLLDRLADAHLRSELRACGFDLEIVVCDDGSSDDTAAVVEAAARRDPNIRLVRHERNRGKGAAVRSALAEAQGDWCIVQDADLEYDVTDYPRLLWVAASGADAVFGSRFLERYWPSGMRPANWVANRSLTWLTNVLFGISITDEATCLKLVRTALLRDLDLRTEGFDLCPEVTAKLALRGVTIAEVPISYSARTVDDGKKIRWTDGVRAAFVLIRARFSFLDATTSSRRLTNRTPTPMAASQWRLR